MCLSTLFFVCSVGMCCSSHKTIQTETSKQQTNLSQQQQQPEPFNGQVVLHIGDSQVAGPFGYHLGLAINQRHAASYVREGKIGKGIRWWLTNNRLQRFIQRTNPDIVLITLGGNDIWHLRNNPIEYRNLLTQFIHILKTHATRFVWMTPPVALGTSEHLQPLRDNVTNEIIHHIGDENYFIDTRTLSSTHELLNRNYDGIHYNFFGGRRWTEEVIEQIERKLLNQND